MTKKLEAIKTAFKGKGGVNPESESILLDNGAEKADGYVSLWTNRSDASKIIEKCGSSIIKFKATEEGVQFHIDRKAFRGIHGAFRKVSSTKKEKSSVKSEAAKLRMQKYWEDKKKNS